MLAFVRGTGESGPITMGGVTCPKGPGVHTDSSGEVCPGGRCTRFTAVIGLDDETGTNGSVVCQVLAAKSTSITDGLDAVSTDADNRRRTAGPPGHGRRRRHRPQPRGLGRGGRAP
ncbi:NPCBM/NEW2 domain-containing protein [Streptomyces cinereospinus]|uniref:NPCBM/NEW2 domain-containing protein n=1 Tax=Streptomyces cinereospinus TaxID=285561 RepID=A0ABV5NAX1_9ACTN